MRSWWPARWQELSNSRPAAVTIRPFGNSAKWRRRPFGDNKMDPFAKDLSKSSHGGAFQTFEDLHGGVVSGNAADGPAAEGARAAEENIWVFGFHTPGAGFFRRLREGKSKRTVKDIS